jgi:hypothetical protein
MNGNAVITAYIFVIFYVMVVNLWVIYGNGFHIIFLGFNYESFIFLGAIKEVPYLTNDI